MGLRTDGITMTSPLPVDRLRRLLEEAAFLTRATSVAEDAEDAAVIAVVAQGSSLMQGLWAVRVHVFDEGDTRRVRLTALGDGALARAVPGRPGATTLTLSRRKRDEIAAVLR